MKSIRRQLIVGLIAAVVAMELAAGAWLYEHVRSALIDSLDRQIAARAQGIAAAMTVDEGKIKFYPPNSSMTRSPVESYYQIWKVGGGSYVKSPALGNIDLPQHANNEGFNLVCPGGATGRGVALRFSPTPEDKQSESAVEPFVIVVAEDATSVRQSLEVLLTSLIVAALASAAGIAIVVMLVVRRSLRPLSELAQAAAAVDVKTLAFRFPADRVPPELAPICTKLNELLGRLDTAFRRERRFTSDVAHELRTPISELRSLSEVALRWPGDETATREIFNDTLQIARQMQTMVVALLAIARGTDTREIVDPQAVGLLPLLERNWKSWEEKSAARQIRFTSRFDENLSVRSDPVLLSSILQNLLSNAVEYTPIGGEIRVATSVRTERVVVTIENTNPGIEAGDLPHLFEPFWRKDTARSDSSHSGLGLALVAEYARILDIEVRPSLLPRAFFCITLTLPLANESAAASLSGIDVG